MGCIQSKHPTHWTIAPATIHGHFGDGGGIAFMFTIIIGINTITTRLSLKYDNHMSIW